MAEHPAVNRRVAGSSPARGATPVKSIKSATCGEIDRGQRASRIFSMCCGVLGRTGRFPQPTDALLRQRAWDVRGREIDGCKRVDRTLEAMGLRILNTRVRAPQANAFCERVIGTIRRECLDFIIPMSEWHVRPTLREWVGHYNRGRSHASLGLGIPEGSIVAPVVRSQTAARFRRVAESRRRQS
jgi:transposase InsO family protein